MPKEIDDLKEIVLSDEYETVMNAMVKLRKELIDHDNLFPHVNALSTIMPRLRDIAKSIPDVIDGGETPEEAAKA